jgi:hypothetical protein
MTNRETPAWRQWLAWSLRIALVLGALYVGWTFYSRYAYKRDLAAEEAAAEKKRAAADLDRIGGGDLKINMFYASPPVISSGESTQLCYGAAFADKVEIEADPPLELDSVWPSLQRCIEARPAATTSFRLKATDKAGAAVEQELKVEVR